MYAASIATNISPERTDSASIAKGVLAFKEAAGCPVIVAGGYSQGAAVMHNVVKDLDQNIKAKIAGVALFGDTRNQQDGGHIKNFPPERSKVWCNATDGVCGGSLAVGITHLAYASEAGAAANWLAGRVNSMKSGGGGSSEGMGLGRGGKGGKGGRGGKGGKGKGGGGKGGKGLAGKGSKDEKPKEDETPKADEKPKVDETPKVNETPKVDEE
jgi:cutinase